MSGSHTFDLRESPAFGRLEQFVAEVREQPDRGQHQDDRHQRPVSDPAGRSAGPPARGLRGRMVRGHLLGCGIWLAVRQWRSASV